MKLTSHLLYRLFILVLTFSNTVYLSANNHDSLLVVSKVSKQENKIIVDYQTIKKIVPYLAGMQGQIAEVGAIITSSKKVEKLWSFYEEAKNNGTLEWNSPLIKELTFSSKYTLFLLDESLDKILKRLDNEHLRLALEHWKVTKLKESKLIYEQDKKDLNRLKKMKPSIMDNPILSNTVKLENLLLQRDSLYNPHRSGKLLSEFRRNPTRKIDEVDLFYSCDLKERASENAPESIMEFESEQAIRVIQLDRKIYQFRLKALASLPYKERQYFQLKKELIVAKGKADTKEKRKILKKKMDSTSHYALIQKEYNQLVDSFSFEEQTVLRQKEKVYNHPLIETIEFWGCPSNFPAFFER